MKYRPWQIIVLLMTLGLLVMTTSSALAVVAANTLIINQATLSYDDGSGVRTSTSSVTVTVALVPAAPAIAPGPNQSTTYSGPAANLDNSFIVTATSNGPDNYTLGTAITASSNTTGPTANVTTASPLLLGATVTVTGSTLSVIVVPSDGVSDGEVNGLEGGDTVVIGGETRTILSVIDNASGTSTINLASDLSAIPASGVLVAEQKSVLVNVTAGTITVVGTDITVDKTLTVASVTDPAQTTTSPAIRDTFTSGVANLLKYVRNVTDPNGSVAPVGYSGNNYYASTVTGEPGDVLEYLLVAVNSSASPVTAAVVTDVLPTVYVALRANAYGAGREVTYDNGGGPVTYSAAADADQANYNAGTSTLTVYIGAGATNAAGGTIAAGATLYTLYQVTINP